ncbi:MAG: tRNA (adenosine(37)-N6)-threonylcarbamoyltransferase complex dimerization subunit type 1 TsaB [Bacteroidia bacterium]|nr:tRNA (adenosine(37)-N6)-threonylcarbamoyltransferase complex dimerization subunit type 1 TsaB [Bacteroidia bacterium]
MIICLETATNLCSVALCNSAGVISLRESHETKSHASMLTIFIEEIFKENGIRARDLEAVAVSKGPGSYTGLRIGVSVAKGIAYAASIPLIGIETTLSMFRGISGNKKKSPEIDKNTLFCPMLDARRMEVYYAIYDANGNTVKDISAEIIRENSFINIPESQKIIFFGDGAEKCKEVIKRTNVHFADDFRISASHMHKPAFQALKDHHFEDVAYFEPLYLKDFITSKPRKNILGK